MTIWGVVQEPVQGMCRLIEPDHGTSWDLWAQDRPENARDVWRAMEAVQRDHGMPPLAQLKHRRTKPVPGGYLAFCCPSCGILQATSTCAAG